MVAGRKRTAIGWNPMEERIPKEASVVEARTAAELLVCAFDLFFPCHVITFRK